MPICGAFSLTGNIRFTPPSIIFSAPSGGYVLPGISPFSTVTGAATTILNVQKSMYLTTAVHGTNAATMPEALTGA